MGRRPPSRSDRVLGAQLGRRVGRLLSPRVLPGVHRHRRTRIHSIFFVVETQRPTTKSARTLQPLPVVSVRVMSYRYQPRGLIPG
jgi:hypothetical protein